MTALAELATQLQAKLDEQKSIFDAMDAENRAEATADERDRLKALGKAMDDLDARMADAQQVDAARKQADQRRRFLSEPATPFTHADPAKAGQAATVKSVGEDFIGAAEYKDMIQQFARPGGEIPESAKGVSSRPHQVKTLITGLSDTSGGALVLPDYQAGIVDYLRRPLSLLPLITNLTTNSDMVDYVKVTGETNNAAAVAEATAASGSSGVKPESALALARAQETVKTIAHWIPVTKRALGDAGQMRGLIDNFLRSGLMQTLEDEMVTGAGTGEHFAGLEHISGVQTQAYTTDLLTTTRKARTLVKTVGRDVPNAYLLTPEDWETIDLMKDSEARYYFGGPSAMGTPRLWGLPVVESEALSTSVAFVGNLRQCVLWDREQANISVSDSHADFFIRNLVAILAEMRAAFGCLRPTSLVKIAMA